MLGSEIIFNSPLVMYTWAPIADALIAEGIVNKSGDTYYIVDLSRLIEMIDAETAWADIGLPQLYGPVRILSTDPTQSNTGYSFAGLLANTLNGGKVVDESAAQELAPQLNEFFDKLGLLQVTTTQLFEQFMTVGMGAYPIIAAYESNLIEYLLLHQTPDTQEQIRQNVRTLYPQPTVWTSQPMIALTPGGQRLMTALRDPEIQRLGWEHHGMRTAVPGVVNNVSALGVTGVPQSIDSVIPMPGPAAMDIIIQALSALPATSTPVATRRDEPRRGALQCARLRPDERFPGVNTRAEPAQAGWKAHKPGRRAGLPPARRPEGEDGIDTGVGDRTHRPAPPRAEGRG